MARVGLDNGSSGKGANGSAIVSGIGGGWVSGDESVEITDGELGMAF